MRVDIASLIRSFPEQALQNADSVLMEPVMSVEVVLNEEHQSIVSADLARRRAEILNVGDRHIHRVRLNLQDTTVPSL